MQEDTIVAIATAPGRGGVAIIRLSGSNAYPIGLQISKIKRLSPRKMIYTSFYSLEDEILDQGLIVYFQTPNSFTGEDIIELHVHGSPVMLDCILNECVKAGARMANPGEFSERAFLNDKMDLTQAEAIADLIQASSLTAARMAVKTLQGDFSKQIAIINEQLVYLRTYVEAAIDFPDEEVDFLSDGHVETLLNHLITAVKELRASAHQGALLREGLSVVIAGKPNAGKSTLINRLAQREVAIVTEIAGTTRDVMREHILLDDLPLHIIDTAGLRESEDIVEKEGIRRAWEEVKQADCILFLIDIHQTEDQAELEKLTQLLTGNNIPIIKIYNKLDIQNEVFAHHDKNAIGISAKSGFGMDKLKEAIKKAVAYQPIEGSFLARRRHFLALDKACELLENGQQQLLVSRAGELLAEDLRQAHLSLCEITGEFSPDDLLGKIFSSFCIGK